MTPSVADTSFVVALVDRNDPAHARVAAAARGLRSRPWLPSSAMAEVCYLVQHRFGARATADLVANMVGPDAGFALMDPNADDYLRAAEVMTRYADSGLDFVDAVVVAVAERLDVGTVLTLDFRHFGIVRPRHRETFTLLPEPG